MGAGRRVRDVAVEVGVPFKTVEKWWRDCGGVKPSVSNKPCRYRRLSIAERERIHAGMERGESIRQIARAIGRSPSTVLREIRANLKHQRYRPRKTRGKARTTPWNYSPHRAQIRADKRAARRCRIPKLVANECLRDEVQARLFLKHSPEQISDRLREDFPNDPEMWVSHETIYQAIYVQGRGELRRELAACLRTGRALRKPHRSGPKRQGRIKDMVLISERPAEVEDRAVPGHWEGDLITGKANQSAIGTLVERSTGFVMLLHLPDDHGALAVQDAMIDAMMSLPHQLRKTVTWDQGIEMAGHAAITLATDVPIYFCDPASPWQRGSNENTNGLLRQYFPKGTDLSGYHPDYLEYVANQLNDRPRKRLGWKTPKERLRELLSDPTNPHGVALAN
ncbi:IS30 family transposase [Demequina sp. NBRC 110055]|uniref:IS30 family transposase n=1 Tax=Demequina sp. NBRC 110055 TaxID=1570344 RepID=UPI0035A5D634